MDECLRWKVKNILAVRSSSSIIYFSFQGLISSYSTNTLPLFSILNWKSSYIYLFAVLDKPHGHEEWKHCVFSANKFDFSFEFDSEFEFPVLLQVTWGSVRFTLQSLDLNKLV